MTKYLCSLRLWCRCLMRASILAVTSSHSLVMGSSWGVVRPLSSCGVSEQETDLSRLLWARHTAAYWTMLSSGGKREEEVDIDSKSGHWISAFVFWDELCISKVNFINSYGAVTDLRPGCGWAGESSSHCWTCVGLSRGYTDIWLSWISLWWRYTSSCCPGTLL